MKLSKLYCNQSNFKNITFNLAGLNVIYADVKAQKRQKKNSHDLGKTLVSKIIDFLFLKKINTQNHFLFKVKDDKGKNTFLDYIFFLEIQLNNGKFLTIKRSVNNKTKISFKVNDQRLESYQPPQTWDEEDVSFDNAKEVLNDYLALDFFTDKDYTYRKAISYSLRMQGDFEDVYRLNKFQSGKHIYWKPFMFDLLGFKGELLHKKYENDKKIEDLETFIKKLKNEYSVNVEERDETVARIDLKRQESDKISQKIDRFDFYEQDQSLISKGVEEIEIKISHFNSLAYTLDYELHKLSVSIKNKFSFNLDKIKTVFNEANIFFPNQLQNDYENLIEFNSQLTQERNKLLKKSLQEKKKELQIVKSGLQELNSRREDLLSYLQDTEVFEKFKFHQKGLVKIEGEVLKLTEKLETIDRIIGKQEEINQLSDEIETTVKALKDTYKKTETNQRYKEIRALFSTYYKEIMNEDAILSWKINNNDNVEFNPPKIQTQDEQRRLTAKDEGTTYEKLLCVAFDLAILVAYNQESYYRFVYHDDVLSQQDNGIKVRLLQLVRSITEQHDIQYILSVIKADLPIDENEQAIYFSDNEIILKLNDNDEKGTLFGFEF
mgnify:CR=1 FL=1